TNDDIGPMPHLEEGVGTSIDTDEERFHLGEIPAATKMIEILFVIDTSDDHQHVTVTNVDRNLGDVRCVDQEVAFTLDIGERVLRETSEFVFHVVASRFE